MAEKKQSITTPRFVVAFPDVFTAVPGGMDGKGDLVYQVTAIFRPGEFSPEDKKRWADLQALLDETSKEFFKTPYAQLPANHRRPLRDGAEKAHLKGYGAGTVFATLKTRFKPYVLFKDGSEIQDTDEIYAGAIARATVVVYGYNKNGGKGLNIGLQSLKKLADGARLDGRPTLEQVASGYNDLGEDDNF